MPSIAERPPMPQFRG